MENDDTKKQKPSQAPASTAPAEPALPEGTIRTLKQGSAEAVKGKQGVVIKMVIAEEKRKEEQRAQEEIARKKRVIFALAGALFIAASIAALMFGVFAGRTTTRNVETPRTAAALKFGTTYGTIDITGLRRPAIVSLIRDAVEQPLGANLVKTIIPIENGQAITTARFFESLSTYPPEQLSREILDKSIVLNIYGGEPNTLFILARARIGTNTLRELGNWETTMTADLADLFGVNLLLEDNRGAATKEYEDVYVKNIATRAVRNSKDKTLLLYALLNDETLVMTSEEELVVPIIDWLYAPIVEN